MGAGKTTVGRHLAELLSREFLDSDHEIERKTGASIPWIFEKEGEQGFRTRETIVIDELTSKKKLSGCNRWRCSDSSHESGISQT